MLEIRAARPGDEALLLSLIGELAVYEKMADEVEATPELLARSLFSEAPDCHALIADWNGEPAGFALYFFNFSTFVGRPGLYLEDLYVREGVRGNGVGKGLLQVLAGIARDRDCGRMEWSVLDWNRPAIDFYHALGARAMDGWTVYRLDRAAIGRVAGAAGQQIGEQIDRSD